MFLKGNVKINDNTSPQILIALMIADSVWQKSGHELTVTACADGIHKKDSLHYVGKAVDIRTKDLEDHNTKIGLIKRLRERLTEDFDLVFEDEGKSNEHLHLEYDIKRPISTGGG